MYPKFIKHFLPKDTSSSQSEVVLTKMKLHFVFLFCLLHAANSQIFPFQHELEYDYEALVQVIANAPELYTSEFLINAKIFITATDNGVYVKLKDVKHTVYSGKGDKLSESNKIGLNDKSEMITTPFLIKYDPVGKVKEIIVDKYEHLWSINIKKGIASMLQLDLSQFNKKTKNAYGFYSDEDTVHGKCKIQYTVEPENRGNIKIYKHHNTYACEDFKLNINIDLLSNRCEDHRGELLTVSSERYYDVELINEEFDIKRVEGFNSIVFNPIKMPGNEQTIFIKQTLNKLSDDKLNDTTHLEEINGLVHKLKNNIIDKNSMEETYDISGKRQVVNQDFVVQKAEESLKNILDYIRHNHIKLSENINDQKKSLNFLIHQIKLMNLKTLENFYKTLSDLKNDDDKIILELFLQALPYAGSYSSILFIRDIIKENKVKDEIAIKMLTDLPFYIRRLDKSLLREFYELIKGNDQISRDVKNMANLAFASMIDLATKRYGGNDDDIKHYIDFYLGKLSTAKDQNSQSLYINVLRNIEVNEVFQQLELIMKNKTIAMQDVTSHSKVLAMWATRQKYIQYPGRVNAIYWPILTDRKESFEVRCTALRILILSATMSDHMRLYWYMQSVKDHELYNNYYVTLYELSKITGSCYNVLVERAMNMLQFVKKPKDSSFTQMLDFSKLSEIFDAYYGYGLISHLTTIGNLATRGIFSIYIPQSPQITDVKAVKRSIYVHIKIGETMKKVFRKQGANDIQDLSKFLTSLKPDDFNAEIIEMRHGRIVYVKNYNIETIHATFQKLKESRGENKSLVKFYIDQIIGGEILIPTDIGVPVSLFMQMPSLRMTDTRFERSKSDGGKMITTKMTYDNVWWYQHRTGVAVYNPIANLWHGSRRVHILDVHVPIDVEANFGIDKRNIKMSLNENGNNNQLTKGFQSHVHRHVFLFDDNDGAEVEKMCTTCRPVTIVSIGLDDHKKLLLSEKKEGDIQYQYGLFDCERRLSDTGLAHLKGKFMKNQLNILSVVKQWRVFDKIFNDLGMCGIGLMYKMKENKYNIAEDQYNVEEHQHDVEEHEHKVQDTQNVQSLHSHHSHHDDRVFCEIGKNYMINIHDSRIKNEINNEWKLFAGDCDRSCRWSVSVKKVEGDKFLGVQLKNLDDVVEVYPKDGYQVILNGKKLDHLTTGYFKGPWFSYKILAVENMLILYADGLSVRIQHDGNIIKLSLPNDSYKGYCYVSDETMKI